MNGRVQRVLQVVLPGVLGALVFVELGVAVAVTL